MISFRVLTMPNIAGNKKLYMRKMVRENWKFSPPNYNLGMLGGGNPYN